MKILYFIDFTFLFSLILTSSLLTASLTSLSISHSKLASKLGFGFSRSKLAPKLGFGFGIGVDRWRSEIMVVWVWISGLGLVDGGFGMLGVL